MAAEAPDGAAGAKAGEKPKLAGSEVPKTNADEPDATAVAGAGGEPTTKEPDVANGAGTVAKEKPHEAATAGETGAATAREGDKVEVGSSRISAKMSSTSASTMAVEAGAGKRL